MIACIVASTQVHRPGWIVSIGYITENLLTAKCIDGHFFLFALDSFALTWAGRKDAEGTKAKYWQKIRLGKGQKYMVKSTLQERMRKQNIGKKSGREKAKNIW